NSIWDAQADRARQEKEHLKRLTTALTAEINAALDTAGRHDSVIQSTLGKIQKGRAAGVPINPEPFYRGTFALTDAIIYRQVAAHLARSPPHLTGAVVLFYALAPDCGRFADKASNAKQALELMASVSPRLKLYGAMLLNPLKKFGASGYAPEANTASTPA